MQLKSLFTSLFLCLLAASATAAEVTVIVDDKPADDVAYTSGTGGNYSGPEALRTAWAKIMSDATADITQYNINIVDTDSSATTYYLPPTSNVSKKIVLQQVASTALNGADAAVTLLDLGPPYHPNNNGVFSMVNLIDFTLRGLASDKKMKILTWQGAYQSTGVGYTSFFINGGNKTTCTLTMENLYVDAGPLGTGAQRFVIANNTPMAEVKDCEFYRGTRQFQMGLYPTVFTRCKFVTTDGTLHNGNAAPTGTENGNTVEFNDCYIECLLGPTMTRTSAATFNNCTIKPVAATTLPFIYRDAGGVNLRNANPKITFNNLTVLGAYPAGVPFMTTDDRNVDLTFTGKSFTEKTNLSALCVNNTPLVNMRRGSLTLTDCIVDDPIDSMGAFGNGQTLLLNFDRSIVKSAVGSAVAQINRQVTATNTIFQPSGATTTSLVLTGGSCTANLTHCTFIHDGAAKTQFILADAATPVTANYCLFNAGTLVTRTSSGGTFTGTANLIFGNGLVGATNNLTGTVSGDPKLTAAGRAQEAGGAATGAAAGSTVMIDIDGDPRPGYGAGSDIGADEFYKFVNSVRGWELFH